MWFWMCLLGVLTIFDYLKWITYFVFGSNKMEFLKKHLFLNEHYARFKSQSTSSSRHFEYDQGMFNKFLDEYLTSDILFVLRLLTINSSDIIVSEIINDLWTNFNLYHLSSTKIALPRSPQQQDAIYSSSSCNHANTEEDYTRPQCKKIGNKRQSPYTTILKIKKEDL